MNRFLQFGRKFITQPNTRAAFNFCRNYSCNYQYEKVKSNAYLDNEKFQVHVNVDGFSKEDLSVFAGGNTLVIKGNQEVFENQQKTMKYFVKSYCLPKGCRACTISSILTEDSVLKIIAPRDDLDIKPDPTTVQEIPICTHFNYQAQTQKSSYPYQNMPQPAETAQPAPPAPATIPAAKPGHSAEPAFNLDQHLNRAGPGLQWPMNWPTNSQFYQMQPGYGTRSLESAAYPMPTDTSSQYNQANWPTADQQTIQQTTPSIPEVKEEVPAKQKKGKKRPFLQVHTFRPDKASPPNLREKATLKSVLPKIEDDTVLKSLPKLKEIEVPKSSVPKLKNETVKASISKLKEDYLTSSIHKFKNVLKASVTKLRENDILKASVSKLREKDVVKSSVQKTKDEDILKSCIPKVKNEETLNFTLPKLKEDNALKSSIPKLKEDSVLKSSIPKLKDKSTLNISVPKLKNETTKSIPVSKDKLTNSEWSLIQQLKNEFSSQTTKSVIQRIKRELAENKLKSKNMMKSDSSLKTTKSLTHELKDYNSLKSTSAPVVMQDNTKTKKSLTTFDKIKSILTPKSSRIFIRKKKPKPKRKWF